MPLKMKSEIISDHADRLIMSDLSITKPRNISKGKYQVIFLIPRFGYIQFKNEDGAKKAVELNGKEFKGRALIVVSFPFFD